MTARASSWLACLVGCLAVWAAVAWAIGLHNDRMREQGAGAVRAEWREAVRLSQRAQDQIDAQRRQAQREADDANAKTIAGLAAAAARADLARDGVLRDLRRYVAAGRAPGAERAAAAPGSREPGADALDLLAGLLDRTDAEAGELARYADQLHAAGQLCERRYDAITTGVGGQ